jgi:hypothetical protein
VRDFILLADSEVAAPPLFKPLDIPSPAWAISMLPKKQTASTIDQTAMLL